jgi:hypothetical protein
MAVADRIGGLEIIGPLASVIIPHARWRLCRLRKAEGSGRHNLEIPAIEDSAMIAGQTGVPVMVVCTENSDSTILVMEASEQRL